MTQRQPEFAEQPVLMGDGPVFAIVAEPGSSRRETGAILLNSGLLHRVGPSRLYVHLSRQLASLGFVTARIDVSGKGDTPRRQGMSAEQSLLKDYDEVCKSLRSLYGLRRFILVGLCTGADDAYSVASARDNVAGLVLLDGYAVRTPRYYVHHYGSRIFRREPWINWSRRIINHVSRQVTGAGEGDPEPTDVQIRRFPGREEGRDRFDFISRHCERCLFIYTSGSRRYYNYEGQLRDGFPALRPRGGLREIFLPGANHTYPLAQHRRLAIDTISNWASDFD